MKRIANPVFVRIGLRLLLLCALCVGVFVWRSGKQTPRPAVPLPIVLPPKPAMPALVNEGFQTGIQTKHSESHAEQHTRKILQRLFAAGTDLIKVRAFQDTSGDTFYAVLVGGNDGDDYYSPMRLIIYRAAGKRYQRIYQRRLLEDVRTNDGIAMPECWNPELSVRDSAGDFPARISVHETYLENCPQQSHTDTFLWYCNHLE